MPGDVVNVASRREALTRQVGASIVVSDGLVSSLRDQSGDGAETLLDGFRQGERQPLCGVTSPSGCGCSPDASYSMSAT